tara:strand:+ start:302 stop:499 length:198 start_codon:yes stop_codon:yes gene_type:complete
MLDDKTYFTLEDLLYNKVCLVEKIDIKSLQQDLLKLGFKIDLRQRNKGSLEVIRVNDYQTFEIDL